MEVVASVVGATPSPEQPLMEAGLDSLGAVELRNTLGTRFGIDLAPTSTIDYPTVHALAAHIQTLMAPAALAGADPTGAELGWEVVEEAGAAAVHCVGMSCIYPGALSVVCPAWIVRCCLTWQLSTAGR